MDDVLYYIGDCIELAVHLAIAVKLWKLSQQTREPAERCLAATMFLWGGSTVVYYAFFFLTHGNEATLPVADYLSMVVSGAGDVGFAMFTFLVFRKGELWAKALVALVSVSLVVGLAGSAHLGDWAMMGTHGSSFYWFSRVGASLTSIWMGMEAAGEYLRSRRRRKLGLCPAMMSNRYALWSIGVLLWVVMDVALIMQAQIVALGASPALTFLISLEVVFATLGTCLLGMGFFPPKFYRLWVEGMQPQA